MASQEPWNLESGNMKWFSKEFRHGWTAHNMSSSSLWKKFDLSLVSKPWISTLSLIGLTLLAERVNFLTEQIAFYTGPIDVEDESDGLVTKEAVVIILWSRFSWLVGTTVVIALLSEYAVEHAGAVIFSFKNKLDISLGIAFGLTTQISLGDDLSSFILPFFEDGGNRKDNYRKFPHLIDTSSLRKLNRYELPELS
ncbi:hypothetical protein GIB67_025867 [Kingdonia uniflora]|uniref:Uncharacterized protein n=1 Tax=Kingdonia uniflora TaxID=39325 RepID=A0A7J7MD59_9MAGN|nr:hypothetical protein GIB67_025867 [Kingdonia uniflora]